MKSRKRILLVTTVALALLLATVGGANAITNGQPDGDEHPYVGLLVFIDNDPPPGEPESWGCSGSLIAPDVVLTAGHCTYGAEVALIWFDEIWDPYSPPAATGQPHTNSKYRSPENPYGGGNGLPAFSYRDVGVVVLDEPVDGGGYAELPEADLVDKLKNKTDLDLVGYGVQELQHDPGGGPPYWTGFGERLYAPSEMVSGKFVHSAEYMKIALNPGGGTGGTCFGDSGGPNLLAGTNTVLAVNSYVTNYNCAGVGYSSRVDITEILDWINTFLD
jgi:hypothetical protein